MVLLIQGAQGMAGSLAADQSKASASAWGRASPLAPAPSGVSLEDSFANMSEKVGSKNQSGALACMSAAHLLTLCRGRLQNKFRRASQKYLKENVPLLKTYLGRFKSDLAFASLHTGMTGWHTVQKTSQMPGTLSSQATSI